LRSVVEDEEEEGGSAGFISTTHRCTPPANQGIVTTDLREAGESMDDGPVPLVDLRRVESS
ncbi:hypothetical protein FRC17_009891, partial [Serendipita sp. 399]